MTYTSTTIVESRQYSLITEMDSPADKEERKREVCLLTIVVAYAIY
jgi:hypothetical protein